MCVLHIEIETDNLDLILNSINLPIYQIYKKGDKSKFRKEIIYETNLISCDVSEKDWKEFERQTKDMITFLNKFRDDLIYIRKNSNQVDFIFDLPYQNRQTFNQNDFLPTELLLKSGDLGIGINLSLYNVENQE